MVPERSRRRVRFGRVATGLLALAATVLGTAAGAWADDGLTVASDNTFEYLPDSTVVRVTEEITVQNVTTDQRVGNTINRLYFNGLTLAVPSSAAGVTAESNGAAMDVELSPFNERFTKAVVRFPNLFSGQKRILTVTFEMPGDAPRSKSFARVNPAYASFTAYGEGDPGQVSVRVIVPQGFDVDTLGNDVASAVVGDKHVYTASAISSPDTWYVAISARNDAALDVHDVDVGDRKVTVSAWPGDTEWASFVEKNLTDGLPALEKLIGQKWPLEKRLSIVEASTPYLYGYAGWFLPLQNKIEVGEDLDDRTLLHELSHAWFNRDLFDARWINEGLAEELSARALAELGGKLDEPETVHLDSSNAVALESWSAPRSRTSDDDSEHWGYNASFHVMRRLTTEIGMDGLARVIDGATRDIAAYKAPGDDARAFDGPDDWKRLLDLLDEAGGSKEADEIFKTYVVPKEQAAEIDERATARTAYVALKTAGGEWAVPEGVIGAMNAWRFVKATPVMEAATAVLKARDELAAAATAAGVTPAATDEGAYEKAETVEELDAVRTHLERQQASIGTLVAARARVAAPRSFSQRTGLRGKHPEAELAAADAAFARDDAAGVDAAAGRAVAMIDNAGAAGRALIQKVSIAGGAGALLLVGGGTFAGVRRRRRKRRRRAEAARLDVPVGVGGGAVPSWPPAAPPSAAPPLVPPPPMGPAGWPSPGAPAPAWPPTGGATGGPVALPAPPPPPPPPPFDWSAAPPAALPPLPVGPGALGSEDVVPQRLHCPEPDGAPAALPPPPFDWSAAPPPPPPPPPS